MELDKEDIKAIRETRDAVIRLDTIIGDGESGLLFDIREQGLAIKDLYNKHNSLKGKFLLLVGILGGSGILTGGAVGILQAIK